MRTGGVMMGLGLMVSGWVLALAAPVLLPGPGARLAFVLAALALELLGLGLFGFGSRAALRSRAAGSAAGTAGADLRGRR